MEQLKVIKFGGDFHPNSNQFDDLQSLIESNDDFYPGIGAWYKKKFLSGLSLKERTAYIIYENEVPVGATILKRGLDAKICSMRILPDAEKKGYGRLLMAFLARDMRSKTETVHFTIPEHVWDSYKNFFEEYGLRCHGPAKNQYRLFDQEFYGSGSFSILWKRVLRTLPDLLKGITINGMKPLYDLVLSLQPTHARALFNGNKQVEIRRRFSLKWEGSNVLVYSSSPIRSFVGSFQIAKVVEGHPTEIWNTFSNAIGCSEVEFSKYTNGSNKVFAIIVEGAQEFKVPITKTYLSRLVERDLSAPQSYLRVNKESAWNEAASISSLLQSF